MGGKSGIGMIVSRVPTCSSPLLHRARCCGRRRAALFRSLLQFLLTFDQTGALVTQPIHLLVDLRDLQFNGDQFVGIVVRHGADARKK
jgi:hypothetical protein